ncbi:MAG: hypothetical protein ACFB6S_08995 [Geminicoccaceae bacterium]
MTRLVHLEHNGTVSPDEGYACDLFGNGTFGGEQDVKRTGITASF